MYEELLKQNIIIELKKLVDSAKEYNDELDSYGNFMREVILNTTGIN